MKLLTRIQNDFAEMVIWWPSTKMSKKFDGSKGVATRGHGQFP